MLSHIWRIFSSSSFLGSGPEGADDLCFHTGEISPPSSTYPPPSRPKSQPPGSNLSLEAQIPALRLKSLPQGSNLSLEAQIPALRFKSLPRGSNLSLVAQIPASKLKSAHTDGRTNEQTKVPLCSTGLRPLWGRCLAPPHSNTQ